MTTIRFADFNLKINLDYKKLLSFIDSNFILPDNNFSHEISFYLSITDVNPIVVAKEIRNNIFIQRHPLYNKIKKLERQVSYYSSIKNQGAFFFNKATDDSKLFFLETDHRPFRLNPHIFMAVSNFFNSKDSLLTHASGFILNQSAALITGVSGAGKSTAAKLIQPDFLLSDDAIAVTDIEKTPIAHSTPIGGMTDGPNQAPLKAILFPVQSDRFTIKKLSPHIALVRFLNCNADHLSCLFDPFRKQAFLNAFNLFQKVPAYAMHFTKDHVDRRAIEAIL